MKFEFRARVCACMLSDCLISDIKILKDLRVRANIKTFEPIVKQSYDSRLHSQILSTKRHLEILIVDFHHR